MDWLNKFINKLLSNVLNPMGKRILRASWWVQLSVLLVIVAAIFFWKWPGTAKQLFSSTVLYLKISTSASAPLTKSDAKLVDASVNSLTLLLMRKLAVSDKSASGALDDSWCKAQVLVSLSGGLNIQPVDVRRYMMSQATSFETNGICWHQLNRADWPPHIPSSAWVVFAMAKCKCAPSKEATRFLISMQKAGGWWGIYPVADDRINASTYATAWAVLALNAALANELETNTETKSEIRQAVERGATWLLSNRKSDSEARWKFYPSDTTSPESISDSALALHVLHCVEPDQTSEIDSEWLRDLPPEAPKQSDHENLDNKFLSMPDDTHTKDEVTRYVWPWAVIATLDAYKNGNYHEKEAASEWLAKTLKNINLTELDLQNKPYKAAEILISLRCTQTNFFGIP